jgi:hypothetical protein
MTNKKQLLLVPTTSKKSNNNNNKYVLSVLQIILYILNNLTGQSHKLTSSIKVEEYYINEELKE